MKLLFIDGNNLGATSSFANNSLSAPLADTNDVHPDAIMDNQFPTGALHGFLKTLAMLRRICDDHYIVVVWDGGYDFRTTISKQGVEQGIIPEAYKANRKKDAPALALQNFYRQKDVLQKAISCTNIPQIVQKGEEADDVIASFVYQYKQQAESIILFTRDKDYYQLLDDNVRVLAGQTMLDAGWFAQEHRGLKPIQWIDVGAMAGDSTDNIFGVPTWGEDTAEKNLKIYDTVEAMLERFCKELAPYRTQFPDISGEEFEYLKGLTFEKDKNRFKYPEIIESMPFTGVALAYENGRVNKPKNMICACVYQERARLAKRLKTMRRDLALPGLPGLNGIPSWNRQLTTQFLKFCEQYHLKEVAEDAEELCRLQCC